MKVEFRDDKEIKPKKWAKACRIPIHWEEKAEKLIQKLIEKDVIEKIDHTTDWVSPAFFVGKPDKEGKKERKTATSG